MCQIYFTIYKKKHLSHLFIFKYSMIKTEFLPKPLFRNIKHKQQQQKFNKNLIKIKRNIFYKLKKKTTKKFNYKKRTKISNRIKFFFETK